SAISGEGWVQRVEASSLKAGLVFVLVSRTSDGVLFLGRSLDSGLHWVWFSLLDGKNKSAGGLNGANVLELSKHDVNRLWVGSSNGITADGVAYVLVSNDLGESFTVSPNCTFANYDPPRS